MTSVPKTKNRLWPLQGLYDDADTTSDNISCMMRLSPKSKAVTLAVANLYLRQQIIFERI